MPSACCGIYGLKTTFGLVSIKGVFPISPKHLDTVGPMARSVNLDSLMAVEIENSIESSIGVALPPASLMKARTIGQIATLIAEHMGASKGVTPGRVVFAVDATQAEDVDVDAISDDDLDLLLGSPTTDRPIHIEAAVLEVRV